MNNICTKFQISNPYRFRKIALDGRNDRLTQNGDCIVALRQLKIIDLYLALMFSLLPGKLLLVRTIIDEASSSIN